MRQNCRNDGNMLRVLFSAKSHMYQKIALLAFFCCATTPGLAQTRTADSLKQLLVTSADSTKVSLSISLIKALVDVDNEQALEYASQTYLSAVRAGDSLSAVTAGRLKGQILRRMDRLAESITELLKVLSVARRNNYDGELRYLLNSLAVAYTYNSEYDKALEYHFQSLLLREKEGNKKQISITLQNIGVVYYRLNNFDLALNYYLQSLAAKEEVNDKTDLDHLLVNIGLCYNDLGDYESALRYFNRALKECGGSCDNQIMIEAESGLGTSYFTLRDYSQAQMHYIKSLSLSLLEKNERWQLENVLSLGKLALIENDELKTSEYLARAQILANEVGDSHLLLQTYDLGADFYTKTKNFEQANVFQRKYSDLRDSTFNAGLVKNLTKVQTQYAERENLAIIANKDEVLLLNEEVISQQRLTNWLLAAVVLITSSLGFIIFRNYNKIKVVNEALDSAKKVIENQNHLLDQQVQEKTKELVNTNESLTKVNDELDNFIYKTSHDIRGPLASLKGMVNLARMDVKDEKALNYLSKLDLTAEKLNVILTRLLIVNRINHAELKPEAVHFEPIIQEILLLEVKKGIPAKVKLEYHVAPDVYLLSDKDMVRLILENLIDNAIKFHNESSRVESFVNVFIGQEDGVVTARVKDNGVGISPANRENIFHMFTRASERSETGGIGLYLAKIATEKLGGDISLNLADNITEFTVKFPADLQAILDKRKEEKRKQDQERMWLESAQKTVQSA
jgi:signal transduction histidine kinase